MEKYLKRHTVTKLTQEEVEILKNHTSIKEFRFKIKNLPKTKTTGAEDFIDEFYATFTKK